MAEMLTHKEVCKLLKMSPNTLATWIQLGYITPAFYKKKQRVANLFSEENLREIQVFRSMIKAGMKRKLAVKLMQYMNCNTVLEDGKLRYVLPWIVDIENYEIN